MSTVPARLLSEEEYLARERQAAFKSEYDRGQTFAMAGASREHNVIAHNLSRHLGNQLAGRGCDVYQSDMKVRVRATGRYAYPDVAIVCGQRQFADESRDVLLNPTCLVEVLSESTANYDRGAKASDYRLLDSLREFLIVAQDQPLIDHYIRRDEDTWTVTRIEGTGGTIELSSLGCRLPLAAVFENIEFPPHPRPLLRVADEELTD